MILVSSMLVLGRRFTLVEKGVTGLGVGRLGGVMWKGL